MLSLIYGTWTTDKNNVFELNTKGFCRRYWYGYWQSNTVTHQSKAISVHNLRDQVRAWYPEGTIFCQNRGCDGSSGLKLPIHVWNVVTPERLKLKLCSWCKQGDFVNAHYAAAFFRYRRELALHVWEYANFIYITWWQAPSKNRQARPACCFCWLQKKSSGES